MDRTFTPFRSTRPVTPEYLAAVVRILEHQLEMVHTLLEAMAEASPADVVDLRRLAAKQGRNLVVTRARLRALLGPLGT
jgi:hypothetical protein